MTLTLHQKLLAITRNLWWTWRPEIRSIFRDIDIDLYHRVYQNPLAFAREIDPAHLEHRAQEMDVPARIDRALRQLKEYLGATTTWGMTHAGALGSRPVAYFCMEFGIHESLPIYSGGLGILAGDHLKGASNLGVPMVGVGLLYHGLVLHDEHHRAPQRHRRQRFESRVQYQRLPHFAHPSGPSSPCGEVAPL